MHGMHTYRHLKIYTTILSFVSVVSSTEFFRVISTRHAASLYVVSFIFYGYQSLKPCATSDPSTAKDEVSEVREWVRFGLLAVVGAFIPLMSPRPFIASVSAIFASISTSTNRKGRQGGR